MMRAGRLAHTITLQRATETVSAAGTVTTTWADFATTRAELVTHSLADAAMAYGEAAKSSLLFRIRHFHGLTPDDRVIHRGQAYEITNLAELGRRVMELTCEVVK
ncbi:phage head closure protein [Devosia sp. SL43]|uniref:phage head closure protein n=1 Tax=Devosia sp. SL43 TaxID=2806348 RepID=UPI001F00AAA0|nr:phage head closure protein [Devosia sp. SL43]UJW85764.1 phage head closure protein [Devosia sp. SL43]